VGEKAFDVLKNSVERTEGSEGGEEDERLQASEVVHLFIHVRRRKAL